MKTDISTMSFAFFNAASAVVIALLACWIATACFFNLLRLSW